MTPKVNCKACMLHHLRVAWGAIAWEWHNGPQEHRSNRICSSIIFAKVHELHQATTLSFMFPSVRERTRTLWSQSKSTQTDLMWSHLIGLYLKLLPDGRWTCASTSIHSGTGIRILEMTGETSSVFCRLASRSIAIPQFGVPRLRLPEWYVCVLYNYMYR